MCYIRNKHLVPGSRYASTKGTLIFNLLDEIPICHSWKTIYIADTYTSQEPHYDVNS